MTIMEAAISYANLGWRVLPLHTPVQARGCSCSKARCRNPGKHPRIRGGAHAATTDIPQLQRWFNKWPQANVGIATGACSGIVVLDEDPRHDSEQTLETLEHRHGKLPDTVESITGGGRHRFFQHPGFPVRNDGAGLVLGPGLDVRGDGGLVVAAPSLHHSGKHYAWELSSYPGEVPIAPLPEWLAAMLRDGQTTDRETEDTEDTEDTENTEATPLASVSPSLCLSVSDAIQISLPTREGERNRKLFDLARALKAVPSLSGKPLHALKPAVRQWHAAALAVIGTKAFDETWSEFTYAWPRVRSPIGTNSLAEALARADMAPLPAAALQYESPTTHRLVKLCLELQFIGGTNPFFLSCRSAAEMIGIDHHTANKLLNMLVADGVLERACAGTTHRAARYRYRAKQEAPSA